MRVSDVSGDRVSLQRRLDVVLYGLIAALILELCWPLIEIAAVAVTSLTSRVAESVLIALLGTVFVPLAWAHCRGRWLASLGIRHAWAYPSLITSLLVSLATLYGVHFISPNTSVWHALSEHGVAIDLFVKWEWLLVALLLVLLPIVDMRWCRTARGARRRPAEPQSASAHAKEQDAALQRWLLDDSEVCRPEDDLLGHDAVARRIARRLSQSDPPTIAVVGPLGSGKSTIKELAKYHLRKNGKVVITDLSLWPFDAPGAAITAALSALIEALRHHVDCLRLVGLPSRYVQVVDQVAGKYGALSRLLQVEDDPKELVSEIGNIANAIGVRFVLWIEDLERFAGTAELGLEASLEREVERLSAVRALLYLLDETDGISVVVADISLRSRFDVGKIARFIERPPRLTTEVVAGLVQRLRDNCLNGYPKQIIDPTDPDSRLFPQEVGSSQMRLWLTNLSGEIRGPVEAMTVLLQTPRRFKSALRGTFDAWTVLCGEIDFDDLLLINVLRESSPSIYAFVDEHLSLFRNGFEDPFAPKSRREDKKHPVLEEFESLVARVSSGQESDAIKVVVSALFPNAFVSGGSSSALYIKRPQAVGGIRHVDYWDRASSPDDIALEHQDQVVLQEIVNWKSGKSKRLVQEMVAGTMAGAVETFVGQFSRADLLQLLRDVCAELVHVPASDWGEDRHAAGVVSVWRMCHALHTSGQDVAQTLYELLPSIVSENLPLAYDVYYFFGFREQGSAVRSLVGEDESARVFGALVRAFCEEVVSKGAASLKRAIAGGNPYVVYWIAFGLGEARANATPKWNVDCGENLGRVLIELVKLDPVLGVQVVAPFVTSSAYGVDALEEDGLHPRRMRQWRAKFEEGQARALFDYDELMSAACTAPPGPADGGQLAAAVAAFLEAARRWNAEQASEGSG